MLSSSEEDILNDFIEHFKKEKNHHRKLSEGLRDKISDENLPMILPNKDSINDMYKHIQVKAGTWYHMYKSEYRSLIHDPPQDWMILYDIKSQTVVNKLNIQSNLFYIYDYSLVHSSLNKLENVTISFKSNSNRYTSSFISSKKCYKHPLAYQCKLFKYRLQNNHLVPLRDKHGRVPLQLNSYYRSNKEDFLTVILSCGFYKLQLDVSNAIIYLSTWLDKVIASKKISTLYGRKCEFRFIASTSYTPTKTRFSEYILYSTMHFQLIRIEKLPDINSIFYYSTSSISQDDYIENDEFIRSQLIRASPIFNPVQDTIKFIVYVPSNIYMCTEHCTKLNISNYRRDTENSLYSDFSDAYLLTMSSKLILLSQEQMWSRPLPRIIHTWGVRNAISIVVPMLYHTLNRYDMPFVSISEGISAINGSSYNTSNMPLHDRIQLQGIGGVAHSYQCPLLHNHPVSHCVCLDKMSPKLYYKCNTQGHDSTQFLVEYTHTFFLSSCSGRISLRNMHNIRLSRELYSNKVNELKYSTSKYHNSAVFPAKIDREASDNIQRSKRRQNRYGKCTYINSIINIENNIFVLREASGTVKWFDIRSGISQSDLVNCKSPRVAQSNGLKSYYHIIYQPPPDYNRISSGSIAYIAPSTTTTHSYIAG